MLQTLQYFWDILWRRRPPSDLPFSPALLGIAAVASVAIGIGLNLAALEFQELQLKAPANAAKPSATLEPGAPSYVIVPFVVALSGLAYAALLRAFKQMHRAIQTITAIIGISLFTGAAVLIALLLGLAMPADAVGLRAIVGITVIVVSGYDLYAKAWILSQAIERPVALSFIMVLSLEVFVMLVGTILLGPQGAPAAAGV